MWVQFPRFVTSSYQRKTTDRYATDGFFYNLLTLLTSFIIQIHKATNDIIANAIILTPTIL